jgi:hypothetical protein
MADPRQLALIHAEIDGELDAAQRAELARSLLEDPDLRRLRDDLHRLCRALDQLKPVEPPPEIGRYALAAMPRTRRSQSWSPLWRYAAIFVGLLLAGSLLYETVTGPTPSRSEVAGTIALAPAATLIDAVQLGDGPVSGRISLYRDREMLALRFDVTAAPGVDAHITSEGRMIRITDIGREAAGVRRVVALPGVPMHGQSVNVMLVSGGRALRAVVLRAPRHS